MIKLKPLIIFIAIPLIFGFVGYLLGNSSMGYDAIVKPQITPPSYIFPIVWTILYILMGISTYLIYDTKTTDNKIPAFIIYGIQLIINVLWSLFFFRFQWFLFSFWWVILLIVSVIIMIYQFYKINKTSAYLQIPYLLWLIFASVLNYAVYVLN